MNPLLAPAVFGEKRGVEPGVKQSSLERQGKVYTEIVPDASKKPLQVVIRGQVPSIASSIRMAGRATMGWWIWVIRSISASISNEFARGNCSINGIESFRS